MMNSLYLGAVPNTVSRSHLAGFTLIEALIAMFIFAWIGLGSYQILDQISRAKDATQKASERLSRVQRVSWRLSQDFRQVVNRPIVDQSGELEASLVHEGDDFFIEFSRAGWSNPLGWPRSEVQRVAYTIDLHPEHNEADSEYYNDDRLYLLRYFWRVLDRTLDTEPSVQVMLSDIQDFRVRYWNESDKDWLDEPETSGEEVVLPRAYEVSIILGDDEILNYIFQAL